MDLAASEAVVAPLARRRASSGQGRPRADAGGDVPKRIFDAAQEIIGQKGHFDVTDKEIAGAAGVSVAMINYYFGSKDGLLFALVDRLCAEIAIALDEVGHKARNVERGLRTVPRELIGVLVRAYHSHPAISRILMAEITRENSIVRQRFMTRYGTRAMRSLTRMFDDLVDSSRHGHQCSRIDTAHAALVLLSVLNAPLLITRPIRHSGRQIGPGPDEQETERWIDFLTDMFDRLFMEQGQAPVAAPGGAGIYKSA